MYQGVIYSEVQLWKSNQYQVRQQESMLKPTFPISSTTFDDTPDCHAINTKRMLHDIWKPCGSYIVNILWSSGLSPQCSFLGPQMTEILSIGSATGMEPHTIFLESKEASIVDQSTDCNPEFLTLRRWN